MRETNQAIQPKTSRAVHLLKSRSLDLAGKASQVFLERPVQFVLLARGTSSIATEALSAVKPQRVRWRAGQRPVHCFAL